MRVAGVVEVVVVVDPQTELVGGKEGDFGFEIDGAGG